MSAKAELHELLVQEIIRKIDTLQAAFDDLNASLTTTTKSSAGDKHETGRAMAQLEQEKLSSQLNSALTLKNTASKIDPNAVHSTVQFGSLVTTSLGTFFISVGLGKIGATMCISATTPMGMALHGKSAGERAQFNGKTIEIIAVA